MRTNAWVRITDTVVQRWEAWGEWASSGKEGPEPSVHDFAKSIFHCIVDWPFAFNAYKLATIDSVMWRMLSFYGITIEELQEGYNIYPNEWDVVGMWTWQSEDAQSHRVPEFLWDPAEALLFMPDKCVNEDCTETIPATVVEDISLLLGQPPRELN